VKEIKPLTSKEYKLWKQLDRRRKHFKEKESRRRQNSFLEKLNDDKNQEVFNHIESERELFIIFWNIFGTPKHWFGKQEKARNFWISLPRHYNIKDISERVKNAFPDYVIKLKGIGGIKNNKHT